jgi:2,3,4,5-tetrahydropyridine-2,6-dicarboxylate N-succinyltransferase
MEHLKTIVEEAYARRTELTPSNVDQKIKSAVAEIIDLLDSGKLRVAEKKDGKWITSSWIKEAVLLSFRITDNTIIPGAFTQYFDKVPLKHSNYSAQTFQQQGVRIVPGACVRKGAFIAANSVIMPSFINIGAHIGGGALIDTWATVGSCAQIGANVHLSGGVGIGGVLEPLQANPTIIEDNCFIGARSEIVEGVIIEENSVISMGVFISQSTPIYDRERDEIIYGRVPAGSVVVSGTLPSKSGKCHLYCAVIVKQVDAKTRSKIGINELLRNVE